MTILHGEEDSSRRKDWHVVTIVMPPPHAVPANDIVPWSQLHFMVGSCVFILGNFAALALALISLVFYRRNPCYFLFIPGNIIPSMALAVPDQNKRALRVRRQLCVLSETALNILNGA